MKKHMQAWLLRFILLFSCCQIVLAMVWLGGAFGRDLEGSSLGGGALYQLFLPCFEQYAWLYRLLSIGLFLLVADYYFESLWKSSLPIRCIRILFFASFPTFLMQMCAVTPYIGGACFLMLLFSMAIRYKQQLLSWKKAVLYMIAAYLLLCLWLSEGALFGALPVAYFFVLSCKERKKIGLQAMVVVLLLAVGFGCTYIGEQMPDNSEDVKPMEEMMLARMTRLHIAEMAGNYPKEVVDYITKDTLGEVKNFPEQLEELVVDPLYKEYGEVQAKAYMKAIALSIWEAYEPVIKHETAIDILYYMIAPTTNSLRAIGYTRESRVTANHQALLDTNPRGITYLSLWSAIGFGVIICLILISLVGEVLTEKRAWLKQHSFSPVMALELVGIAVWYAIQSEGTMDERKALFLLCIWVGWAACAMKFVLPNMAEKR